MTAWNVLTKFGAVLLLLTAAWLGYDCATFWRASVDAVGTVISLRLQSSRNSQTLVPTIAFRSVDDREHRFEGRAGEGGREVGAPIAIRYRVSHPTQARIATLWGLWPGQTLLGAVGTLFLIVGLALPWAARLDKKLARKYPKLDPKRWQTKRTSQIGVKLER